LQDIIWTDGTPINSYKYVTYQLLRYLAKDVDPCPGIEGKVWLPMQSNTQTCMCADPERLVIIIFF